MSRNAFPQLERDYAEELAAQEEAKARMLEWLAEHAMPDTAESYQRDQIAEHAGRTIPGQR